MRISLISLVVAVLSTCTLGTLASSSSDGNTTTAATTTDHEHADTSTTSATRKGLKSLFKITNKFIDAVAPKEKGSIIVAIQDAIPEKNVFVGDSNMDGEAWKEIAKEIGEHFAGIYVCFFLGLLLFLVLPCTAIILFCCRCFGGCNKEPYYKNHSSIKKVICVSLFIVILVFLAAATICIFLSNSLIYNMMNEDSPANENMMTRIIDNLNRLESYVKDIASGGMTIIVTKKLSPIIDKTNLIIADVPQTVEAIMIKNGIMNKDLLNALNAIPSDLATLKSDMSAHDTSLTSLKTAETTLKQETDSIRGDFIGKLSCGTCADLKAKITTGLVYQRDYSLIPTIDSNAKSVVDNLVSSSFANDVAKGNTSYYERLAALSTSSQQEIQNVLSEVSSVNTTMLQYISEARTFVDDTLDFSKIRHDLEIIKEDINKGANPARLSGYIIGGVFAFVVFCLFCGLLWSICHGSSSSHKRKGSTTCMMLSVYFTLLVTTIISLITAIMFISGTLVVSEGCRHFSNLSDSSVTVEVDNIIKSLNLSVSTVSVSDLFSKCMKGEGFFEAGNFASKFQLMDKFNISYYPDLVQKINDTKSIGISFTDVEIMNADAKSKLDNLASSDLGLITFDSFNTQHTKAVFTTELSVLIGDIETFMASQISAILKQDLNDLLVKLKSMRTSKVSDYLQKEIAYTDVITSMNGILRNSPSPTYTQRIATLRDNITSIDAAINSPSNKAVLKQAVNLNIDKATQFLQYALIQLGRGVTTISCDKMVTSIQNTMDIFCVDYMNPFNTYWFCSGWFTAFSILAIIFGIKISYYFASGHGDFEAADFNNYSGQSERTSNSRRNGSQNLAFQQEAYPMKSPPRYQDPPHYNR